MAYPPNYTPPTMHMPNKNANHVVPVTFEGQKPQLVGHVALEILRMEGWIKILQTIPQLKFLYRF